MYVKMMHEDDRYFTMLQIHKGQSVSLWQIPGEGLYLQIIENEAVINKLPIFGPVYIMSETGKTIATLMVDPRATSLDMLSSSSKGSQSSSRL